MSDTLAWISFAFTVVGAIGLATLGRLAMLSREYGRLRRYLGFGRSRPLTIVLVTSAMDVGGIPEAQYKRPLVSLPTLQAAAVLTEVLGSLRYQKPVVLSVSETLMLSRDDDIAVLGGPIKNRVASQFIELFNEQHPDLAVCRDVRDDGHRWLQIGDWARSYAPELQPDGSPAADLALLIAWRNPFCVRLRRGVLCGGFTAWGTAAAARFFAKEFPRDFYAAAKRDHLMPWSVSRNFPCYVAALDVVIVGLAVVRATPCFFAPLEVPKPMKLAALAPRAASDTQEVRARVDAHSAD